MANWSDPRPNMVGIGTAAGTQAERLDAGLRSYMLSVYNYMASGVLLTGLVAMLFSWGGANSPAAQVLMAPGILKYVIMFSPILFVMALSFGMSRMSTGTAQAVFWGYAAVNGLGLSAIFLVYTGQSVAQAFFATAAAFAGLSLFGYTTKRNLSAMGAFLVMGVFGLLIAMVINIFLKSTGMELAISMLGVLIFAGLTAWDTQRIKSEYAVVAGTEWEGKRAINSALSLYLDFINMFLFLLRLMGNRD
ncbi:Bax inhibitor-1/YccA family protein [Sphingobium aquiterrae]|uniref:Bax inhibitor-1/YccA family protein n=1 Tax=Sphingobium aquiterrae TaxID=2038656 RepID=UPI00301B5AE8